jgi:hypothetical protein
MDEGSELTTVVKALKGFELLRSTSRKIIFHIEASALDIIPSSWSDLKAVERQALRSVPRT